MKHSNYYKLWIGTIALIGFTGCTEVQFTPGEDIASKVVDPPIVPTLPQAQKVTEEFTQADQAGKTDVLVVVDNSGSMFPNQEKMGERIQNFLSQLSNVDWQLGITTTDISGGIHSTNGDLVDFDGTGSHILTKNTPNYESVFLSTVTRDETFNCHSSVNGCPSKDEQPLMASIMAMQKSNTSNRNFFRDDAALAIVILSDEDEYGNGGPSATPAQTVIDYAKSRFGQDKVIQGYAIIIEPGDQTCFDEEVYGQFGNMISDLATLTGGITGSICDSNYGDSLSAIGDQVRKLVDFVELTSVPKSDSLKIEFNNDHGDKSYEIDGKKVIFNNPPPVGTEIAITYEPKEEQD